MVPINTLLDRKGKQTSVKQLIIDDIIISDDKSIAESFNDYFINVGINIATESEQLYDISSDDQMPKASIERYPDIHFKFADINVNNVATSLSNLKVSSYRTSGSPIGYIGREKKKDGRRKDSLYKSWKRFRTWIFSFKE